MLPATLARAQEETRRQSERRRCQKQRHEQKARAAVTARAREELQQSLLTVTSEEEISRRAAVIPDAAGSRFKLQKWEAHIVECEAKYGLPQQPSRTLTYPCAVDKQQHSLFGMWLSMNKMQAHTKQRVYGRVPWHLATLEEEAGEHDTDEEIEARDGGSNESRHAGLSCVSESVSTAELERQRLGQVCVDCMEGGEGGMGEDGEEGEEGEEGKEGEEGQDIEEGQECEDEEREVEDDDVGGAESEDGEEGVADGDSAEEEDGIEGLDGQVVQEGEEGMTGEEGGVHGKGGECMEDGEGESHSTAASRSISSAMGERKLVPQRRQLQLNSLGQVINYDGGHVRSTNARSKRMQAVAAGVNAGKIGLGYCELEHIRLIGDERPENVLDLHIGGNHLKRRLLTLGLAEHVGFK